MSVEKTLHVQVIYIQGHFSVEWQVKKRSEIRFRGEQGGKIGIPLSTPVQNAILYGQKPPTSASNLNPSRCRQENPTRVSSFRVTKKCSKVRRPRITDERGVSP